MLAPILDHIWGAWESNIFYPNSLEPVSRSSLSVLNVDHATTPRPRGGPEMTFLWKYGESLEMWSKIFIHIQMSPLMVPNI